jgi:hypothetical protein
MCEILWLAKMKKAWFLCDFWQDLILLSRLSAE